MQTQTNHLCQAGHQILNTSCKYCKELRKTWYDYLKNTGFNDLEEDPRNLDSKTTDHLFYIYSQQPGVFEENLSYYQWAQNKLNEGRFSSERDKLIWEHHTEALSTRQISPRVGLSHSYVSKKLRKIKRSFQETMSSMSMMMGIA